MPSFMIHTICGEKMLKKLKLDEEDKKKFFISNLMPDIVDESALADYTGVERARRKMEIKRTSHFRTDFHNMFEYPDVDYFLSKYENQAKEDINFFAYFFHLYTDYYYFIKFLSKILTYYDKDHKIATEREKTKYIRVNRTNKEMLHNEFWNGDNKESIYEDYSRLNKYLVNKYPLTFNHEELMDYIKNHNYKIDMEEINSDYAYQALETVDSIIKESLGQPEEEPQILTIDQVEELMDNVVNTFLEKYDNIITKFKEGE